MADVADSAVRGGEPRDGRFVDQGAHDELRGMFGRDFGYLAASIAQMATSFLLTPLQTRVLGPRGYGQLSLAIALCQLGSVLLCLGLHSAVQRRYHQPGGAAWAQRLLGTVTVVVGVIVAVLVVSASAWAPIVDAGRGHRAIVAVTAIWAGLSGLAVFALVVHRAADRLGWYLTVAAIQGVVAPVVGLGVAVHGGALGYVATLALLQVVATGLAIGASRPQLLRRGDGPRLADALGFALPLVPQQAASLLLAIGDRVVVQRYLGSVATGRYSAAYAVGSLGVMVASALNQVWMTRIYRLGDGAADLAALDAARDRVLRLAAVVTVGVAAGAPLLYRLWLPGAFRGGQLDLVTSLVACSLLPFAAYGTNLWTALRLGASGRLAAATIVAAAVNLGLNVLLVPPLGLVGSALATLIGYGLLAVAVSRWVIGPASRWSCRPRSWLAVAAAGAVAVGQSLVSGGTAVDVLRAALTAAAVVALLVVVHRGRAGRGTDWAISEVWARFGSTP